MLECSTKLVNYKIREISNPCLALPRRQAGGRQECESVVQTSYDIVKAHGGTISVESQSAGEVGTEFIIQLPI